MKFNPITNKLFTDEGKQLKQLHCPLSIKWGDMIPSTSPYRDCSHCSKRVYDTAALNDTDIKQLININPDTCFKIDLNQTNLTITYSNE